MRSWKELCRDAGRSGLLACCIGLLWPWAEPAWAQGPPTRAGARPSRDGSAATPAEERLLRALQGSVGPRRPARSSAAKAGKPLSDEEELKKLEESVGGAPPTAAAPAATGLASRATRFFQSLNPNISLIGSIAAAYYHDRAAGDEAPARPLGGHDPRESGFNIQEFELSFQAEVDPYFRFDGFFSFGTSGVELEEGYFSTLGLPAGLQIRLGYFNLKFGRQNRRHLHRWGFVDQALPIVRLLGTDALRAAGFETSWVPSLPWYLELTLSISPATGEQVPSFVGAGERESAFHLSDPRHLLYLAHLAQQFDLSADWALSLGLSYAVGPNASGGYPLNMTQMFGGDLFLKWRPLRQPYTEVQLTVEGYGRHLQVPDGTLTDWGMYAEVLFRLSQRWWVGARYDMVEIEDASRLARFDFASLPTAAAGFQPSDDQNRLSVSLTWRPTEFSQIRLQYSNNWIRRSMADAVPGRYGQVHEVFLQFQGNIGTHGAHPY